MSFRKSAILAALFASACLLVACGGGSSIKSTPPPSNTLQGVYQGSTSTNGQFVGIVIPNDNIYAVYLSDSGFGLITGAATETGASFSAPIHDFFEDGTVNSGTLSGTFVAGASITGTVTELNAATTLTGQIIPSTQFNYSIAAKLSDIAGTWNGTLLDSETAIISVDSAGAITGTSSGNCSFTGTAKVDASGKNFFDVTLTYGASPCLAPNQAVSGVAIVVPASGSSSAAVLAAVKASDNSMGTIFLGTVSPPTGTSRPSLFR